MLELETPRLTLRLGTAVEPTSQALQAGFEQYKIAHEHPDCPFKAYRDTVLSIYFEGQLGRPYGLHRKGKHGFDAGNEENRHAVIRARRRDRRSGGR